MRCKSTLIFCLLGLGAAAPAPVQQLHYVAYAAGLRVLDLRADAALDGAGYDLEMTTRTVGLFGVFVDNDAHTRAEGHWAGAAAVPDSYDSRGSMDGEHRQTTIQYVEGQPVIRALIPPNEGERQLVPPVLQANTIDSLSAMAELVHLVQTTGRCDGAVRVFDGRRLSDIAVQTRGMEILPRTPRSYFAGPALRCDFQGTLLAGFKRGDDPARAARPQHGSAWFAPISAGGPEMPVRVQFQTKWFGAATMYLTGG